MIYRIDKLYENGKRIVAVVQTENAIDYSRLDSYTLLNRKEFGISDATAICLMFGHDMCRKGVDIAINAIKGLVQEKDIALFVVIVSDLDKTKQKLQAEFGEVPAWVKFLPPRDDIATYYHFADVFLSPSREEGFCYALPEAAYSGCQVVFSNIEGQMHAVGIPGSFLFESESVQSLHNQIKLVLDQKASTNAKEYVCKRYNLSSWSEAIIKIYRNL